MFPGGGLGENNYWTIINNNIEKMPINTDIRNWTFLNYLH